ncbi:TPA: phage tail fiber protein [Pseudomonas aeruginosa]
MTVETTDSIVEYTGNGVTTAFPVPFEFPTNEDLVVTQVYNDVSTVLVLGTDYLVVGAGAQAGGAVITTVAPPLNSVINISRQLEPLQKTDLRNQGRYFAETHESVFDYLTMLIQQGFSGLSRALRRPLGKDHFDAEGRRIANVESPVQNNDAANKVWTEQYVGSVIGGIEGNPNNSANVLYIDPDGIPRVVQDLSGPNGANYIGRGTAPGSVEDALQSLESRASSVEGQLSIAPGRLFSIVREFQANTFARYDSFPQRIVSKAAYDSTYDHFGVMDLTPRGELILLFRRGTIHTGGSDGKIAFRKLLPSGVWGPVTIIAQQAGQDFRAAGGGVMPSGRIVVSGTIWFTGDMYIYVSDDYGDTWYLKKTIPKGTADYRLSYGKAIQVGNKFVLPYYMEEGSLFKLRWLETTDGGETWVEGATIYSGLVGYNEAEYVNMGGGYVLGIARNGTGVGGKLRQFLSTDGGTTWTDQGDVTAQNGDGTDTVVAPSLSYVTNKAGTAYVALFYTNRTTQACYYRTNKVSSLIAGSSGWSDRIQVYSAPAASGYSSQVVLSDSRVFGNVYRETSGTKSGAYQFEVYLGGLPDFETDWVPVSASSVYTFAHGLRRPPRNVVIHFAKSTNPTEWYDVDTAYYNDGANRGSGARIEIGGTNIRVGTGSAVWGTGYFGGFDSTSGDRAASGYYRIQAFL